MAENRIYRIIEVIAGLFFAGVLVACVICDNRYYYMYQNHAILPNLLFLLIAVALYIRIFFKVRTSKEPASPLQPPVKLNVGKTRKNLFYLSLALFLLQLLITYNIFFKTGWDCKELVHAAQDFTAEGKLIGDAHYFSLYPNNVFLVGIFSGILEITNMFGIASDYFVLVGVGAFLVALSGYFMGDLIRALTNNAYLVYSFFFIFAFLTGLSPWVSVPYSDTYSIIFPITIMWTYVNRKDRSLFMSWFFIVFLSLIGYFIKPTVLLTLMAIVFITLVHFFCTNVRKPWGVMFKKILAFLVGSILGTLMAISLFDYAKHALGFTPDKNQQVTPYHYFMMGMNVESGGGYNQWDVNYSFSAPTVEARNEQDYDEAMRRIREMGPNRFMTFMVQKALTNFNDGSFAWGNEGEFYWYIQERNNIFAPILRAWYYEDGAAYKWFIAITQGVWFITLTGLVWMLFSVCHATDYRYTAVRLSVFFIACFLMIFEARARYLFLYSPLIFAAEALGINIFITRTRLSKR